MPTKVPPRATRQPPEAPLSSVEAQDFAAGPEAGGSAGVEALAARLAGAELRGEDATLVLAGLCRSLPAAAAALVVAVPGRAGLGVLATHPPPADPRASPDWLRRAAWQLQREPAAGVAKLLPIAPLAHVLAAPSYGASGRAEQTAVFLVEGERRVAEAALERLKLATGLLALANLRRAFDERGRGAVSLARVVHALSAVGSQTRFQAAAMAFCNEAAARWGAQRVSLGMARGGDVTLEAMSLTEQIDRKVPLVRALEEAMEECLDQDAEVAWPRLEDRPVVAHAAERLAREHGRHRVFALVLHGADGTPVGVALLELSGERAPGPDELDAFRVYSRLAAPLLARLREDDRPVAAKLTGGARAIAARALGPERTGTKVAVLGMGAFLVATTAVPVDYRVASPFLVQPMQRQVVAAPFDGYLAQVGVDPGDFVRAHETVLAALDVRELELERAKLAAERERYRREADVARRDRERAEQQIAESEVARLDAEIGLVDHRLRQAELRSPTAGVVVEGDRRPKIGAAVARGDPLFEVAPVENLRIELQVPEGRIDELAEGRRGEVVAASHPGTPLPIVVERIEPMAEIIDGQNVFRVRAVLEGAPPAWLRPGMEGLARVDAGKAPLAWGWTREALDWIRMRLWW